MTTKRYYRRPESYRGERRKAAREAKADWSEAPRIPGDAHNKILDPRRFYARFGATPLATFLRPEPPVPAIFNRTVPR